ncbi:hypothetical protein ACFUJU_28715 [Streptomyces sp. NPDC057235]|uniref:hypothetical protein n=1 Tax=Streptomyces sp. NPDC057235 TaxID=3346058 RepID=UPI0036286C8D
MPSLPPPRTTELYYDGAWHPVSVRESDAVTITRGFTGKGTRAEPNAATMRLGNRHGEVSAHDPAAPLYGKIGRNTPIKFAVHGGHPYLLLPGDATSALTCPDSPALGVTDLDLRIEMALDSYTATQELAARGTADSQRSWSLRIGSGWVQLSWYPAGTFASQKTASVNVPVPAYAGQRIALRVVLDTDTGTGGHLLSVYWGRSLASRWTLLGTASAGAGTTTLLDGTAGLHIGTSPGLSDNGARGKIYGAELWDGATGARRVALDFSTAKAGDTTFTAPDGLVWTTAGAATLSNKHIRLEGEVPAWPPEQHISGADATVAIAPAGIMRRLGIGKKPLDSALRRYITAAGPVECWPLTDGASATAGVALRGGQAATVVQGSTYAWTGGTLADWVEPVLHISGGGGRITILPPSSAATASRWSVDWCVSELNANVLMSIPEQGNSGRVWSLLFDPVAKTIWLRTTSPTGAGTVDKQVPAAAMFGAGPHHIRLTVYSSGGHSGCSLYIDGVLAHADVELGPPTQPQTIEWLAIPNGSACSLSLGYVTLWGTGDPPAAEVYRALIGYPGETAGARIVRIATEQGVPITLDGTAADTEPLDVQERQKFLDTLETASASDLGLLLERRDARALLFRARHTLYSQAPAVTLRFTEGVISGELRPVDDDRLSRNEVTVKRDGGSEHTAVLGQGRMSVQDPPLGIGQYDEAVTLSLQTDGQTVGQAWWRMHLGTHEGLRYPRITVDLANPRAYALTAALLAADIGDILRLDYLPGKYGYGPVDLLIRGYTDEVGADGWRITFVCDPGEPWTVGILGHPTYGRVGTAGTTLGTPVTATDTTLLLVCGQGRSWLTTEDYPTSFPLDLRVGGEIVRATSIRGIAADRYDRTVASGWGAADSGQTWTRAGGTAADFSVSGGVGMHAGARGTLRATTIPVPLADIDLRTDVSMSAVPAGGTAEIHLMARRLGSGDFYAARLLVAAGGALTLSLRKFVGGTETQLATYTPGITLGAGTWYTLRLSVQGTALTAKMWPRGSQEPDWQVTATDSSLTLPGVIGLRTLLGATTTNPIPLPFSFDNLVSLPQQAEVVRSVNRVVKAHAAGADVALAQTPVIAL